MGLRGTTTKIQDPRVCLGTYTYISCTHVTFKAEWIFHVAVLYVFYVCPNKPTIPGEQISSHLQVILYSLIFSPGSDDGERETASSGLTQEIDSAVERIMSSVMSSPGVGGRSHVMGSGEEFTLQNLRGWEMHTTSGISCIGSVLRESESSVSESVKCNSPEEVFFTRE